MEELTGQYYFKKTWFGLVLMVECEVTTLCKFSLSESPPFKVYRKATQQDLIKLKI